MGKPTISVRKHICWASNNGGEPSEPTSTIVLTTSRRYYVDIRMLKSDGNKNAKVEETFVGLDWAFAGTSSTVRSPIPGDDATIVEWRHWIDSRSLGKERGYDAKDVGRCFPQPNGDELELGNMINPDTGVETEYEELWGTIDIKSTSQEVSTRARKAAICLQTMSKSDWEKETSSGMVVRVGQFIQGLIVTETRATLERWSYDASSKEWIRLVRLGDAECELPCQKLFEPDRIFEGKEIRHGGLSWCVKELFEWTD